MRAGVVLVSRPPALFRLLTLDAGRAAMTAQERSDVHVGLVCGVLAGLCAGCAYCIIRVLGAGCAVMCCDDFLLLLS
jgi:hypothetical protein